RGQTTDMGTTDMGNEECNCGVFVATKDGESEIYAMETELIGSCDDITACKDECSLQWLMAVEDGDLDAELSNGKTLGEELCHGAHENHHEHVENVVAYVYARACDGPWTPTGDATLQDLCCTG
ncbi:unnamed protein product, partial [Meganyctiphanes norvegica]